MLIELKRVKLTKSATLGQLYIDGVYQCVTLEDVCRFDDPLTPEINEGVKVWGKTAIPAGVYKIILNVSARFKRVLPRLLDVLGFTGILIHKGNTSDNTHGCILVGMEVSGDDYITHSTEAFNLIFPQLEKAFANGEEIMIVIRNEFLDVA
jgi:hypothetical protein